MIYKSKYLLLLSLLCVTFFSCKKDYLDINQNPNNVTENSVTSDLVLPFALHNAGDQITGYGWLNHWVGYWSPSGSFSANQSESTYNISSAFGQNNWNSLYNMLLDFQVVENKAPGEGKDYFAAIAKVMKAFYFQNIVDIWGNVPYSQAFQLALYKTPKYDKGEAIYADLQVLLDDAIAIFTNKPVASGASSVDIMFRGNASLWIKFANTIKLRLLIRQSEIPGFSAVGEIAKIQANGGVLQSGESATVNPGYVNETNKQSPFYRSYGFTPTGTNASEIERANNYILGILKGGNDVRLSRFFRPATAPSNPADPFIGTTYGAPPNELYGGNRTASMGPGLAASASQPQWILTSVESLFLYAEAVARGWFPGSAQAAYENAVRESFKWLNVPNATSEANNYLQNIISANWANAGATVASQTRFIVYQKYLSLVGINSLEAWSDYRRLGVPVNIPLSVDPGRVGTGLPVRLLYPTTEFAVNAANVNAEGSINQFSSRIFWDQ